MSKRRRVRGRMAASCVFLAVSFIVATLLVGGGARAGEISFQQFDLVTLGNFSSPSDVEGSALIGGSVTGTTWNVSTNQTTTASTPTLIVGNTLSGTVHVEQGSLLISSSGDITPGSTVNFNGGGSALFNPSQVSSDVSTVAGQLQAASAGYAALTANNSVSISGNTATFNATSVNANGVAVFSVAASALSGLGQYELNTVAPGVKSIIIDVTGSGSFSEQANFIGNWSNFESTTLWNFSTGITSITTGAAWDGALMALGANLTNKNDQDGAVFVGSMTAQSEVHLPLFDGFVPASVPEPSSIALLSMSTFFGLGCWFKRRVTGSGRNHS
jgi:choice-of-anchor A domain-containing protein